MIPSITHDSIGHRFSVEVDGLVCELDYRVAGTVMTITHTRVPESLAGRGIASLLMTAALDIARARAWKVVPACSYAAAFMLKHPESEDLRFSG